MTLGIMQPYVFPYIGYFQYIAAVDSFVLYDDVAFIRQGWINRNNILQHGKPLLFTVPLKDASSFRNICDTEIAQAQYQTWRNKFYKTLEQCYRKAPFFDSVLELLTSVFKPDERFISQLAGKSISDVCNYIGISTPVKYASGNYTNQTLSGEARVIDICRQEGANQYINPVGGQHLYHRQHFALQGIDLKFISVQPVQYPQYDHSFVPSLSIIDVLMFNDAERIKYLLTQYQLT